MNQIKHLSQVDKLAASKKGEALKIFIVEDDEYFNNILGGYIEQIGDELNIKVDTCSYLNGNDCIQHIDDNPDFVILDFYLDDNEDIALTGSDVLEKITRYNSGIKVIVISQRHEWQDFEGEFRRLGASCFLKKDEMLYENLKNMISQHDIDII